MNRCDVVRRMIRGRFKIWHRDLFMKREICRPFDPDDLDPGIRKLVLELRDCGFETTDSGDGQSKGWRGESYAHVHMVVARDRALDEADRLQCWCYEWFPGPMPTIQLTYSPLDRVCVLSLYPVTSADMV